MMEKGENAGKQHFLLFPLCFLASERHIYLFIKPTCYEQDIVVTTKFGVIVRALVSVCVCLSDFVWSITSTIVGGFQKSITQLFSIMCRCAI